MESGKLYWFGNCAKAKIINEIVQYIQCHPGEVLVFDYGCGNGGDWPNILTDYPQVTLIGYDPSEKSIQVAKSRLKGFNAELFTGSQLNDQQFKAHFIISFSVLEHVYDRRKYLQAARTHLRDDGIFYLNYDDGHFRNYLDLNRPELWRQSLREWLNNIMAHTRAGLGNISSFQARVQRNKIDRLVKESGLEVTSAYYSNLANFKGLYKTIPSADRESFMRFWIEVEDKLNSLFLTETASAVFGDHANLWQFMTSRTLVLKLKRICT